MFATEFEFTLPKGYLDNEGELHQQGVMRLATAIDEISALQDPRVQKNPAYSTVLILTEVITCLGALDEISSDVMEGLFAEDLDYLQNFYCQINRLENKSDQLRSEGLRATVEQTSDTVPASA